MREHNIANKLACFENKIKMGGITRMAYLNICFFFIFMTNKVCNKTQFKCQNKLSKKNIF